MGVSFCGARVRKRLDDIKDGPWEEGFWREEGDQRRREKG